MAYTTAAVAMYLSSRASGGTPSLWPFMVLALRRSQLREVR
jgi:hypothetical protein